MHNDSIEHTLVKVNLPGGVISVGDLDGTLECLKHIGVEEVRLGARQQLYFYVCAEQLQELEYALLNQELSYEIGQDAHPNIVSSYVTDSIFSQQPWIREGVYRDVLDSFNFLPKLKINVVDSTQSLVPYYTGNLNFITSEIGNYWYLYLRFPTTTIFYLWSSLVYSDDIAMLSRTLEPTLLKESVSTAEEGGRLGARLEEIATKSGQFMFQPLTQPFVEPSFKLPYYEGFNGYHDRLWLGVYKRSEVFSISFLQDICAVCKQNRIGQIYTTPWKSIIIKEIQPAIRAEWDLILDRHRVNLRHALNELNWQTEDYGSTGLALKQDLVHDLNRLDVRTYKLSFGIKMCDRTGVWGAVILRFLSSDGTKTWFQVLHTRDFNPNSKDLIVYRSRVERADLSEAIVQLCEEFYAYKEVIAQRVVCPEPTAAVIEEQWLSPVVYQCPKCKTIYHPHWGDVQQGIAPKTAFKALPVDYQCSLCGTAKDSFLPFDKSLEIPHSD
ncbi:rubredoxin [Sphingobacterium suaedae]|uniref:Rubredoxin n=1 Tax=Sphingobacterium suaedae TaxID=1686402 RepID=A0ABW5KHE7_9SPHI